MLSQSQSDIYRTINQITSVIPYVYNTTTHNDLHVGELKWTCRNIDYNGWLVCDGRELLIADYPKLHDVIGTSFGGNFTHFNLPDSRSRVLGSIGAGPGLSTRAMGLAIGSETHTLTSDEMPGHVHSGTTDSAGAHNHSGNTGEAGNSTESETVSGGFGANVSGAGTHHHSIPTDGAHSHTFTTGSTGGGGAHNNMQPSLFIGSVLIFAGFIENGESVEL